MFETDTTQPLSAAHGPVTQTCEDRDYRCCDLTPPIPADVVEMSEDDYLRWYDDHVAAWEATR